MRPPVYPVADLDAIVPADSKKSFDMKEVIARITDGSEFREFKAEYGKTIITVSGIATSITVRSQLTSTGLCRDTWAHVSQTPDMQPK